MFSFLKKKKIRSGENKFSHPPNWAIPLNAPSNMFWPKTRPQGFFFMKIGASDAENRQESQNRTGSPNPSTNKKKQIPRIFPQTL